MIFAGVLVGLFLDFHQRSRDIFGPNGHIPGNRGLTSGRLDGRTRRLQCVDGRTLHLDRIRGQWNRSNGLQRWIADDDGGDGGNRSKRSNRCDRAPREGRNRFHHGRRRLDRLNRDIQFWRRNDDVVRGACRTGCQNANQ